MEFELKLLKHQRNLYECKDNIAGLVCGRGAGKTVIMAWIITFALLRGERIMAFSQTYKSLSQNLFNEIVSCFEKLGILINYNKTSMTMTYDKGQLFGFSYDSYESCRGLTEINLLVLDEMFLAPSDILSVTAPCLRGNFVPKIRFGTSPRKGSVWNRWAKNGMADGSISIFTAKMSDNTFLSSESLALSERAILDENMKRQELYGEILDDDDDSCIVYERDFVEFLSNDNSGNYPLVIGIDGSGQGRDKSVICMRKGNKIISLKRYDSLTGIQAESEITRTLAENKMSSSDIYEINIDMGYGQGLYESLSQFHGNVNLIAFASKAKNASYSNRRAEMYFNLAKAVKSGLYICDKHVRDELLCTRYILDNSDRYLIIPKEEIRDLLGRSPDSADALALTYVNEYNAFTKPMSKKEIRRYAYMTLGNVDD